MRASEATWALPWIAMLALIGASNIASCGGDTIDDVASGSVAASASTGASASSGDEGIGGGWSATTGGGGAPPAPEITCSPAPPLQGIAPDPAPDGVTADYALPGNIVRLAVGPDGNAAAASVVDWREIAVRRYVNGQWSDVERIAERPMTESGFGYGSLAVAAGPSGKVVVVYAESIADQFAVCARVYEPGAGWSSPELLGVSNEGWWQEPVEPSPVAAMNGNGNAIVVWSGNPTGSEGIFARRFTSGAGFSALETLTPEHGAAASLALHEDDSAVVAWLYGQTAMIEARPYDPASGWGAVEPLAQIASAPHLAVGPGGSTVAVWSGLNGADETIEASTRPPMGAWSAPETLHSWPDSSAEAFVSATPGFGIGGWSATPNKVGCYSDANVRLLGADGVWQPESPVPGLKDGPAAIRDLSANSAGRAVVAWTHIDPAPCNADGLSLSWFDAATASWSYEDLDPSATSSWNAKVSLSPQGRALVGWQHGDSILVRWADPPP